MVLFLDRVPFLALTRSGVAEDRPWGVPLPIIATEGDLDIPRRPSRFYPWLLDTAFTGRALVWRSDLRLIGLDPERPTRPLQRGTESAYGQHFVNRERTAALWLFSNVPSLLDAPLLLPIGSGLEVHVPAAPEQRRGGLGLPLVGTRLLIRAGLRADSDYGRQRVSAWVPATWLASRLQLPRRLMNRFDRQTIAWHRES